MMENQNSEMKWSESKQDSFSEAIAVHYTWWLQKGIHYHDNEKMEQTIWPQGYYVTSKDTRLFIFFYKENENKKRRDTIPKDLE